MFTALLLLQTTVIISQVQLSEEVIEGMALDRLEHYEDYIKREVRTGRIPGAVTLIARNGETVYKFATGISNPSDKRQMKTDDIFYIQSMTKPIITAGFMMLFEEGHFLLTDPLSKYLPAANSKTRKEEKMGKRCP